jgi:ADP-heptose:LPS heptosyltransferase
VNFIEVLPIEKISQLSFKIPSYYSRNVREIGSLIANTDVFIGADSGIMHLASAVKTPTIGLFSVTNEQTYGPYDNSSTGINTNFTSAIETCLRIFDKILQMRKIFPLAN